MAEFCLECWNKINGTNRPANDYVFSKEPYLCEGCGKWKNVIVTERKHYYDFKIRFLFFPFIFLNRLLIILCKIFILPYVIYKYRKADK